jgi:prefoldin beta subunit
MEKEESSQLLNQAQLYSQQIQNILAQKTALMFELNEIKKSLEEIGKTKEKSVYKLSGPILIRADTEAVKKDLGEKENTINLRVKTLEKQEARLKEKIEELRTRIIKVKPSSEAE